MMLRKLTVAALLLVWLPFAAADERSQTRQKIEQVSKDIAELQNLLKKTEGEKTALERELQNTEKGIGDLLNKIRELEQKLKQGQEQSSRLQQQDSQLRADIIRQQEQIARQARATYQAGQPDPLRLLLNQQNTSHSHHNMAYYSYMHQARLQQISQLKASQAELASVQQKLEQQQQQLVAQKKNLQQQQQELEGLKQQRQQRIAQIARQQQSSQQRLKARQQDKQQLDKVLATIEETLARQAAELERRRLAQQQAASHDAGGIQVSSQFSHPGGNFSKAKGKLPWPISGSMISQFGTARGDERSTWDGVLIQAAEGTPIKAIHPGRVVFSDWLRGAGLLVIIDHGNGYLSLYGHNQSIISNSGESVKAGQVIATVGNSGGYADSALYFAIRKQGKALDPGQWCRT